MHHSTRGFTLIELLIAITLGIILVYTATAAFRVAAQTVTTTNRLSLENAVLRAGYQIAHRDLDFWTNVDDPDNAMRQGLRPGGAGSGMPFTPFATSWPGSVSDSETANGHDPRDLAWAMGNKRVWWRGNMAEKNNTDLRFGRYSLFANRNSTLAADQFSSVTVLAGMATMNSTYGGPVSVPHSWLYNQISGLEKALGFYGLCDYLPSNAVYAWYEPYAGNNNLGGMPFWLISPNWPFNNGDGGQQTPRGKYRNSYQTSYAIIDPRSHDNPDELRNRHRRHYHLGYGSGENSHNEFNSWSAIPDNHLPLRPTNWPGLDVSVQRFIKNTRFVNLARVTWTNPITGQTSELSFTGFGTTLRGARQQRKSDGGWAKWDNDGSTPDRTLDSN
jgi:prepilin-type N-terminal cleavage/methylation domain-containing protein